MLSFNEMFQLSQQDISVNTTSDPPIRLDIYYKPDPRLFINYLFSTIDKLYTSYMYFYDFFYYGSYFYISFSRLNSL